MKEMIGKRDKKRKREREKDRKRERKNDANVIFCIMYFESTFILSHTYIRIVQVIKDRS